MTILIWGILCDHAVGVSAFISIVAVSDLKNSSLTNFKAIVGQLDGD